MDSPLPRTLRRRTEAGGITILVALMMLIFLTLTAVGMSRNSFREVVISGTARQGSLVRNAADSGIEWTIFWQDSLNTAAATGTALALNNEMEILKQNDTLSGIAYNPITQTPYVTTSLPTPPSDLTFTAPTGTTEGFTVGLTRMGKLPITDMSQGAGTGAFTPAAGSEVKQAPDLWAVRSDAQLTVGSGATATTFRHAKEAWISTPVSN